MALIADRVQETTTTTGTGAITLAGAIGGYRTFSSAFGSSASVYYAIVSGSNWEIGIGTLSSGSLARSTITASSNGNGAIILVGTSNVFCNLPASIATLLTSTTGSGALVQATSPTLVTPQIGGATSSSVTAGTFVGYNLVGEWASALPGSNPSNSNGSIALATARGTLLSPSALQSGDTVGNLDFFGWTGASYNYSGSLDLNSIGNWTTASTPTQLVFSTTPTGSTTPTATMTVDNTRITCLSPIITTGLDANGYSVSLTSFQLASTGSSGLQLVSARGTQSSPSALLAGDDLGSVDYFGYITSSAVAEGAEIRAVAGSNWTSINSESFLEFQVAAYNTTQSVGRMRLSSTGNLLIGQTSDNGIDSIQTNGSILTNGTNSVTGYSVALNLSSATPGQGTPNASMAMMTTRGTISLPSPLLSGDLLGNTDYWGYAQATSFSGYIAGTSLTITSSITGTVKIGQQLLGGAIASGTFIISGSGTNWVVGISQSIGSSGSPVAMTTQGQVYAASLDCLTVGNFTQTSWPTQFAFNVAAVNATVPSYVLTVSAAQVNSSIPFITTGMNGSNYSYVAQTWNGLANGTGIQLLAGRGTQTSPTAVLIGDTLGNIDFYGQATSSVQYEGASVSALALSTWNVANAEAGLIFNVTAIGGTSTTERMRLSSNGQLLINASTQTSSASIGSITFPSTSDGMVLVANGGVISTSTASAGNYNFTGLGYSTNNSNNSSIGFKSQTRGTAVTNAGDTLGVCDFWGWSGAAYAYAGSVDFDALNATIGGTNWTTISTPSQVVINTTAVGAVAPGPTAIFASNTTQFNAASIVGYSVQANSATFNGYIVANTLTVSSVVGTIAIGQQVSSFVSGAGITDNSIITGGSGTTWTVNNSQTVASSGSPVAMVTSFMNVTSSYANLPQVFGLQTAAGTTVTPPIKLSSGTKTTTPVVGAIEYDGSVVYATSSTAGRGVVTAEQYVVLNTPYTLTSQTTAQQLFNATATGALTLPIGTYQFECVFALSSMSASSGSFGFGIGGTAVNTQAWDATAYKMPESTAVDLATSAATWGETYNTTANQTLVVASTSSTGWTKIRGIINVTTTGTIIPQVYLGIAAVAVIGAGSFFKISAVSGTSGSTNAYSGQWS